jgi:hypothetical protein
VEDEARLGLDDDLEAEVMTVTAGALMRRRVSAASAVVVARRSASPSPSPDCDGVGPQASVCFQTANSQVLSESSHSDARQRPPLRHFERNFEISRERKRLLLVKEESVQRQ